MNDQLNPEVSLVSLHQDMELSAQLGKLRYITDDTPGFTRKRRGKNFQYLDTKGAVIKDEKHLARIKSLVIPPAWQQVWISPYANGHLQATGRDIKGRKQYRYHSQWRAVRDEVKYEHMIDFGLHLPMIRQKVDEDLSKPGLSKDKVLATIIYLLENTMIRIGNDEYVKTNKSFGLTTLRNRHVEINGSVVKFKFRGKSKIEHDISLQDARMARIIKRIMDIPGQELFQYIDSDGVRHPVSSSDVNAYLKQITGRDYTAKDFRTWSGTMHATMALKALAPFENITQAKKNIVLAIEAASKKLGNTPSICKKCYVHPFIIESYMAGAMFDLLETNQELADDEAVLDYIEQYILKLLQNRQALNKQDLPI
ncbi:MAG TPA: DNA topoisomerase IB [Methylotenera sp.]|nr:DNA topoisomerase IB [Methylotenera sp.]